MLGGIGLSRCPVNTILFSLLATLVGGGGLSLSGPHLGLGDDLIDRLGRDPTHFHEVVRFDHRQIVVGEKSLADEFFSDRLIEPRNRGEAGDRTLDLLVEFLTGHDLDIPAAEFAGEADVLAPAADRQRQLILTHEHDAAAEHLTEDHLVNLSGLEGVGDQDLKVVAPPNNVDPLAAEFLDDVFDAIAANADTGADAVDTGVGTDDGHLAPVAGLTRDRPDLDHAVGNLGNLLLEQSLHELGTNPGENNLHPAADLPDLEDRGPDPLVGVERLAGNLLTARQNRLGGPEGDGGRGPFEAAHDARDHQADLFLKLVVDRIPLCFADLLDDDLFGRLGTDPPRQFGRVDLHTVTAAMDAPVGTIDRDLHIGGFAVLPRQSGDEGRLDRLKDDLLVDVLVAVNRIDDAEDFFWLHGCLGRRSRRTRSWSVFLGTARGERRQVSILRMSALPRNRLSKSDHAPQRQQPPAAR